MRVHKLNMRNLNCVKAIFFIAILSALSRPGACEGRQQAGGAAPDGRQGILLWPGGAPGALGSVPADQPRLWLFPAPRQPGRETHTGILVIPGGGYVNYSLEPEGIDTARWLNNLGVSAFILQYRLAPRYAYPAQFEDGIRAMRWVRQHATEFNLDPKRIGVWGSSAGGHLASMLATEFDSGDSAAKDPIERASSRPDFVVLVYPVIEPLGFAAVASLKSLAGPNPSAASNEVMMTDKHVTPQTPPTFLMHANDDTAVDPESSIRFYLALRAAGVPAELHIYQHGGHGFGLALYDPVLHSWTMRVADWLRGLGVLNTN
jgi:acetyl esterase/lipase